MHHHTHTTTGIQQLWPWAQQRAPLPGMPQQHQQWYSSDHDLVIRPGWQNLHHLHHTEKHPVNAQTSSSHIHHQWPGLPEHTEWDFVLNRLELRTILWVRWPTCSLKCYSVAACQTAPYCSSLRIRHKHASAGPVVVTSLIGWHTPNKLGEDGDISRYVCSAATYLGGDSFGKNAPWNHSALDTLYGGDPQGMRSVWGALSVLLKN